MESSSRRLPVVLALLALPVVGVLIGLVFVSSPSGPVVDPEPVRVGVASPESDELGGTREDAPAAPAEPEAAPPPAPEAPAEVPGFRPYPPPRTTNPGSGTQVTRPTTQVRPPAQRRPAPPPADYDDDDDDDDDDD